MNREAATYFTESRLSKTSENSLSVGLAKLLLCGVLDASVRALEMVEA
jgi:hypothetical protein